MRHTERYERRRRPVRLDFPAVASGAAFFDLDKTVIAKSSALAFGRPFYRERLINRRDVIKSAYAQLMFKLGGADDAQIARIRDHLATLCKGWSVEQVEQIVNETLAELISPYIYAEAAALIEEHRAAGRAVVLVSASGEEMVRPIGQQLGIDEILATRMVVKDGRYTGDVGFYNAGPNKVEGVRDLAARRGWDLADCYAYSDSVSDVPLLESVGRPTAVNADRGLRRSAIERGWPMLEFRHPIPLGQRLRDRPAVPVATAALGVSVGVAIGIMLYGRHRKRAAGAATIDAVAQAGTRASATKRANALRRADVANRTNAMSRPNGTSRANGTRGCNATSPGKAGNVATSATVPV
jgi:HAD superfamily hydrolase (TIGR01490 family)